MRRVALLLLAGCAPAAPPLTADTVVTVAVDGRAGDVDPRFLSVAVDLGQVVGNRFWNPDATDPQTEVPVGAYDFDRPALRTFAAALSPGLLRIGGTESDRLVYGDAGDAVPDGYDAVMPLSRWDDLADFAADAGLDVMFTLNAGPGPRGVDGAWDPTNAARLLDHAASRGDPVAAWELGNEPNGFVLQLGLALSPEQYGADLATAAALRDTHDPDALLVGASVAFWPVAGEIVPFLERALVASPDALDAVTWHYYPQQGTRCPVRTRPATPTTLLDPAALDEAATWAAHVEALRDAHEPGAATWLGESGNAQCGGEPGVSDTFASTLWWVDELGLMARRGHAIAVRQTLSGSDYGLLDDTTLALRPDAWASLLWKRLMGPEVVAVASDLPTLRAYGHCHPDGGLTLALVNLGDGEVGLDRPGTAWVLTADALTATDVRLGGDVLATGVGGALPALDGEDVPWLVVPSHAVAFLRVDDDVCP